MKILYVYLTDIRKNSTHLVQIFQMCSALSEAHEVKFFHPFLLKGTLDRRLSFFDIHPGIGFHITRVAAFGPLGNKYLDIANRVIFFFQVLFYLHFSKHDLIYTRDFSFLVFLSKVPKFIKPKTKIVYEPHNVYYYVSDKINDLKVEVESLKLADVIIATSSGIKHDLIQIGVDERKINVASNGVNINRFSISFDRDMFRKNNNISDNEIIITYLGSWEGWKGVDVLIKAYAQVLGKVNDCKLILAGGSKEEVVKANELIKSLNIDRKKILLVGFISQTEVVKYLKISDIGVIPNTKTVVGSRYTSPLKLFEYMAAGLAIVASDLPSVHEIVTEQEAVFFKPENEHDLADKLINLINNKSKREQIKFSIRQRIKEFTYEERCKKVVEIIERII